MFRLSLSFLAAVLALGAQDYTLGVGVYPGDPQENFAPSFRVDGATYRNLALHRAGVPIEQLRLQPDRAIGDGRHQGNGAAALGGRLHQPARTC